MTNTCFLLDIKHYSCSVEHDPNFIPLRRGLATYLTLFSPFLDTDLFFLLPIPPSSYTVIPMAHSAPGGPGPCLALWALSYHPPLYLLSCVDTGLELEQATPAAPSVLALAVPSACGMCALGIYLLYLPFISVSSLVSPPKRSILESFYLHFKYYPPSFSGSFLCLSPPPS